MGLGAVDDVRNLLVIDGQAFARLGEVSLLGGLDVAGSKLRYAVIIGGLQAAQQGAVAAIPGGLRRQNGRHIVLAIRIPFTVQVAHSGGFAQLIAQLVLAGKRWAGGIRAEFAGGVDAEVFGLGNLEAVLIGARYFLEPGGGAILGDVPRQASAGGRSGEGLRFRSGGF